MKLISMTDFVLEQVELYKHDKIGVFDFALRIKNYANFIKQPLTIGMFVKFNKESDLLFKGLYKRQFTSFSSDKVINYYVTKNFQDINIIEIRDSVYKIFFNNIEELIYFDLELTELAIKQIGL